MEKRKVLTVRNMVFIGMFGAVAAVLESFQIAVPFAPPFYKLDFAETPILIGAFAIGPMAAVFMEMVKVLLHLIIKGTTTMFVGDVANFIGSLLFVLPASIIYKKHKTKKMAMVGLGVSVVTATLAAVFINSFITLPLYGKIAFDGIENIIAIGTQINPSITNLTTFVIFAIVPFNIVKCSLNSLVTVLLYKRLSVLIHGAGAKKASERGLA